MENGKSFVIFPEGTRYKGEEGGAGEFKAGAFRIAVKTGAPVVPVAITGARALFENNGSLCHPGSVHIKVLPPIRTESMSKAEQKQLPDLPEEIDHVSYLDGSKVYFKNGGWVIARFSGTEPLLRIFCEMPDAVEAADICTRYEQFLDL